MEVAILVLLSVFVAWNALFMIGIRRDISLVYDKEEGNNFKITDMLSRSMSFMEMFRNQVLTTLGKLIEDSVAVQNVKKVVVLLRYYEGNPGVGHTMAVVNGVKDTRGIIVLVANSQIGVNMKRFCPDAVVLWWSMSAEVLEERLCGLRAPLVIDNSAMLSILKCFVGGKDE